MSTLRSRLAYEPRDLKFGTSGRRGEVVDLTQLEVYINARAEVEYLLSLERGRGGILRGDEFYLACDLRPSSTAYVPERGGRGEIAQAVARAIHDAGMRPVYLGWIPTPALACYALARGRGSIMVTGSHIPFDRNGYKTNTARGELLKEHEQPINEAVARLRKRVYEQPFDESPFDEQGRFKQGHQELPAENGEAAAAYIHRYTSFFTGRPLEGMRLLVYQHSAVGRDLLVEVLRRVGADAIPAGRSETFVPIDTENIDAEQLAAIQTLVDDVVTRHGRIDAVISTDGDSDRPLILGVDAETGKARFYGGDLVGMLVAEYLGADAVVVPVSCNDAIDRGALAAVLEPKTRIGSPFVIAGMEQARRKGRRAVCGWEANGGFLTGSDIMRGGRVLAALPTRDALLPILAVLSSAREKGLSLAELFGRLPRRFSRAALLKQFPRRVALGIVERFSRPDAATLLAGFFTPEMGFGAIERLDYTDGVRIFFANGDVAHLRPSGNADEFRIYAVADTAERADAIAQMGVAEPDGILRRLEKGGTRVSPCLLPLRGTVRHYEWGGYEFIPGLLGVANPSRQPFAELWLGAHPSAPSRTPDGVSLDALVARAPEAILGAAAARRFGGRLPYLLKVLDARQMLSIQAHPAKGQAEAGFARENAAGIGLDAAHRNYKDDNHKPELHVALTDLWMLHGFRPLDQVASVLEETPELRILERHAGSVRQLYTAVMEMPQERVDAILNPLVARLERESPADKDHPDFWALRAAREFSLPAGHRDRGIFSVYLLNLAHLGPGHGTFQPAGVLHAYLEGVTVELMANSDNVLRGGLTPKHVDVAELLRTLSFEPCVPEVLEGTPVSACETVYRTAAEEFELSRVELATGRPALAAVAKGPETFIVLAGSADAACGEERLALARGESVLVRCGCEYRMEARGADATLFRASIP